MLERMWNMGETPPLLVGVQTCRVTSENNMAVFQKTVNQSTRPIYITLEHMSKGYCIIPQEHLLNCVHSSFVSNS